ncbi:MAG TPA: hypothetical protein VKX31_03115 [Brumimicrobium sp.]|nr:hypothetical protein [Brumimicrobium sp.]
MTITLDFFLLFLLFIIPGLIFKRLYFFGEFSKQFSLKDNAYTILLFSFIPGIVFQLLGYLIYWLVHKPDLELYDLILSIRFYSENKDATIPINLSTFFIHQFNVNLLAGFTGLCSSRTVRKLHLDRKTKLFRYGNQWYYIFSGEIETFKKFKTFNARVTYNSFRNYKSNFKHYPPRVDILVGNNEHDKTLYTGYLIDYDLEPRNIHSLDKVYLKHVYKYRSIRDDDNPEVIKKNYSKIPIFSDIFVLDTSHLININITFIPSAETEKENRKQKFGRKSIYRIIYNIGFIINVIIILDVLFNNLQLTAYLLPNSYVNDVKNMNWLMRLLFATLLNFIVSIPLPVYDKSKITKEKVFTYKGKWRIVFTLLIFIGINLLILWLFW